MTLLLVVVAVTVGISAMCSLFEATLMSTRIPTLEAAKSGPHGAAAVRFLAMKGDIAGPTAAILILNTIANTAGATYAGSLAVDVFGEGALGPFSVAFTLAILFLAEIVPKTLGAVQWRVFWRWVVWPLSVLRNLLGPIVWLTERTTAVLAGTRRIKPTTEGEIAAMIRLGASVGELSRTELELLTSVLRFDEMRASEVMVPRRDVETLGPDVTVAEALHVIGERKHSRYPLCEAGLDEATTMIHLKDLAHPNTDPQARLRDFARPLTRVPVTVPISNLLRQMQRTKRHMVLVLDEFGSAVGIVTLEDVLEEIVGSVQDEFDDEVAPPVVESDGSRVLPGSTPLRVVDEMFERGLESELVETLNGWILEHLGRLPRQGDELTAPGLVVQVVEVRRDQAAWVRIRPNASVEGSTPHAHVPDQGT